MKRNLSCCVLAVALAGCASTILNHNTLDLASTTDKLLTRQIGQNLANFLDSKLAFPAQLVITSGTATTADSLNPTLTAPLAKQVTNTAQVVTTLGGNNPNMATTHINAAQLAGQALSLNGTDTQTQNWSFNTITDSRQARRLSALYRFAVDGDEGKLKHDYPLIQKSVVLTRTLCLQDHDNGDKVVYGMGSITNPSTGIPSQFSSCVTQYSSAQSGGITLSVGSDSSSILVPDEYYLKEPECVLCFPHNNRTVSNNKLLSDLVASDRSKDRLAVNERLKDSRKGNWLHWRGLPGATQSDKFVPGDVSLGTYGNYELFVDQNQPEKFADFALFILAAGTDADSAIGSGGSGSGGGGGGGGGGSGGGGGGHGGGTKASPAVILLGPNTLQ